MWGMKGEHMLRPKSKGSWIMVSDFVDERSGYLALSSEEFTQARKTLPDIKRQACQYLEIGEAREGYRTSAKFIAQMEAAVIIAELK